MDIKLEELIKEDFTITEIPSVDCLTMQLTDLNSDCLRLIFRRLDMATQFALAKCSKYFFDLIVYEMWKWNDKENFVFKADGSFKYRPEDFQAEFLELLLLQFASIESIPIVIFKKCMEMSATREYPKVVNMKLYNTYDTKDFNFELENFDRFPSLISLDLEKVIIRYSKTNLYDIARNRKLQHILRSTPTSWEIRNYPKFSRAYRRAFASPCFTVERFMRKWYNIFSNKIVTRIYERNQ